MVDNKVIEVQGNTVEEAVQDGLRQLGLTADEVEVEVLDPGSRGFLGLGSRDVRVRLTAKDQMPPVTVEPSLGKPNVVVAETEAEPPVVSDDQEDERLRKLASTVVSDLLVRMRVEADVETYFSDPDDQGSRALLVDILGDDLGILIGRRAETLNALQYIVSLIISKEEERWVHVVVDIEGYRTRREMQIRQLARKMADQAVKTGRMQVLEPMPANERRIVHLELRNHPEVTTESIGEEPTRKVTIQVR